MDKTQTIYQIRIWCSNDNCTEFWYDKELSDYYANRDDAEKELSKYNNLTPSQLEKKCKVICVGENKPYIETLTLRL